MIQFFKNRETYPNVFIEFKVEGKSKLTHNFEAVFPGKTTEYVKPLNRLIKIVQKSPFRLGRC